MIEYPATHTTTTPAPVPPVGAAQVLTPAVPPAPVDPRTRALLIAVRRALLIVADGIGDYCGIEKKAA